jgi:large subunit ribosomal protein L18
MAKGPRYAVKFRREREGKTDYTNRLALLKSRIPRLIVRISNKNVRCQIVEHSKDGDRVLADASSKELQKMGWKAARSNLPTVYLAGYLCGKKAKKAAKKAVLDTGFKETIKGSKIFAALKGALDAGIEIPHDESVLPSQDRLEGAHIDAKVKAQVDNIKQKIDSKY